MSAEKDLTKCAVDIDHYSIGEVNAIIAQLEEIKYRLLQERMKLMNKKIVRKEDD